MPFQQDIDLLKRIAAQSEQDLFIAIEVQGIHIKGAYDPIVSDALDNTMEAWGHGTVLRSVFAEQVIALIRLWDDRGDVLSLPRAESIFQALGFVGNFVDMEAPHRGGHGALQERKEMIRMQIAEFQRKYRQATGDHTLARLRSIRNETLAHNAEAPVGQRAEYGYADRLLEKTIPVVEAFNLAARSHGFVGQDFVDVSKTRAEHFWDALIRGIER